jgi:hypothetical protein
MSSVTLRVKGRFRASNGEIIWRHELIIMQVGERFMCTSPSIQN